MTRSVTVNFFSGTIFAISLILICLVPKSSAQTLPKHTKDGTVIIENFQGDSLNKLPVGWYNRDGDSKITKVSASQQKRYKYNVLQNDGNKFLRYEGTEAMHINLPLINEEKEDIYNINIYETPILSWKVRAHSLPKGAREDDDDKNDSVASLYVVFGMGRIALFKKVPITIRYSWSSTLEKGETTSKLFGNQQIIIVKSGSKDTGKWITFKRNLVKDYRRMFDEAPPNKTPLAILLLSEGDNTHDFVKADYDDIKLLPKEKMN